MELYYGPLDPQQRIVGAETATMTCQESIGEEKYLFVGTLSYRTSGRHGYTLRILPRHEELISPFEPGFILWA